MPVTFGARPGAHGRAAIPLGYSPQACKRQFRFITALTGSQIFPDGRARRLNRHGPHARVFGWLSAPSQILASKHETVKILDRDATSFSG